LSQVSGQWGEPGSIPWRFALQTVRKLQGSVALTAEAA
jgi:hypothetical protein